MTRFLFFSIDILKRINQRWLQKTNFKLVGIISGDLQSYVSLVDASGAVTTLGIFEELSEGVKLVDLKIDEAVFQKNESSYLIINFKNQIRETAEIN